LQLAHMFAPCVVHAGYLAVAPLRQLHVERSHVGSTQGVVSQSAPSQNAPLLAGFGLLHARYLDCQPLLSVSSVHSEWQRPVALKRLQPPSRGSGVAEARLARTVVLAAHVATLVALMPDTFATSASDAKSPFAVR